MGSIRELLMRLHVRVASRIGKRYIFFHGRDCLLGVLYRFYQGLELRIGLLAGFLENSYKPNSTRRKLTWEPPLTKNRAPLNKKAS